ncbi:MAG: hypothetical protein ACLPND_04830, partial [Candidatus Korobacteraceae bacterium]
GIDPADLRNLSQAKTRFERGQEATRGEISSDLDYVLVAARMSVLSKSFILEQERPALVLSAAYAKQRPRLSCAG